MAFIGPAAWLLGMLALAFRPNIGRSRAIFGLAVGALLATLLRVAADTGTAAVPWLPDTAERSGFSSYMIGQLVWVMAAIVGLLGFGLSRLARKLPSSPGTRATELSAGAVLCALLLVLPAPAVLLLSILGCTYCIGRWLDVHPVAARPPDVFVLGSLAASFALVYFRA
ncbi:MAG TPA: hypothetical protein VGL99_04920 [Chloroflexota bacterium]